MGKFNEKIAAEIIEFIETDAFTISEICRMMNISRKTFYNWQESNSDFAKEVEEAKQRAEEKLLIKARRALNDKLEGNRIHETIVTYVPDENSPTGFRVKKKVEKVKTVPPRSRDIEWVIERADRIERIRKQKESEKPRMTFEQHLEDVKQKYGYYQILQQIHEKQETQKVTENTQHADIENNNKQVHNENKVEKTVNTV